MPNFLTVDSTMMCPHGGSVQAITSNTSTQAGGAYVVGQSDTFLIAGCAFTLPDGQPNPCLQVQWVVAATQSTITSDAPLNESSVGLCIAVDGAPQGSVIIAQTQPQVAGT